MVSSGQVRSDLSSITSVLSQYKSLTSELSSSWQGDSFDNFMKVTEEFYSSFKGQIEGQMNSFAEACDLYEEYRTAKANYNISSSNYNSAVSNNDASAKSKYSSQMSQYKTEMESLKTKIQSALQAAGAVHFDAGGANVSTTGTVASPGATTMSPTGIASYQASDKNGVNGIFTDSNGKQFTVFNQTQIYKNQGAWGVSWDQNDKCTRCSVASVLSGVSNDAAMQALNRNAGFGSSSMPDTINQCSNGQLSAKYTPYSADKLKEITSNGGYAIVYVNPNPGRSGMQWTGQQHAMAILDYRENNGGEVFVSTSGRQPSNTEGLWVPYNEFDNSLKSNQIIEVRQN